MSFEVYSGKVRCCFWLSKGLLPFCILHLSFTHCPFHVHTVAPLAVQPVFCRESLMTVISSRVWTSLSCGKGNCTVRISTRCSLCSVVNRWWRWFLLESERLCHAAREIAQFAFPQGLRFWSYSSLFLFSCRGSVWTIECTFKIVHIIFNCRVLSAFSFRSWDIQKASLFDQVALMCCWSGL